jgi:hypothetical protein
VRRRSRIYWYVSFAIYCFLFFQAVRRQIEADGRGYLGNLVVEE